MNENLNWLVSTTEALDTFNPLKCRLVEPPMLAFLQQNERNVKEVATVGYCSQKRIQAEQNYSIAKRE